MRNPLRVHAGRATLPLPNPAAVIHRLVLLLLLAGSVAAQDGGTDARVLVAEAYDQVLDGSARSFSFRVVTTTPDTTLVDVGRAVTALDPESATARFRVEFDDAEISVAALSATDYRVAMPRTRAVYVDSTMAEVSTGPVGLLMLHPAFGAALYSIAGDAESEVLGLDAEANCTRATYVLTLDAEGNELGLDACFDVETGLPSELTYRDSGGIEARMTFADMAAIGPPAAGAFDVGAPADWRLAPYDSGDLPILAVGDAAPGFELEAEDGTPVSLSDFRGRYVLVDFWGTWCAPCVEAIPHIQGIADTYPDLAVLGLASYEEDADDPAAFVRQRGGRYPVVRADQATVDAWQVHAFPTYVVVDPQGEVVFVAVEDRDPDAQGALDTFLASLFD